MEVNKREVFRYLGFGRTEPDDRTKELTDHCIEELKKISQLRFFSRSFQLTLLEDDTVDFSCFKVKSRDLSKNLKDCDRILLFGATLGMGADLLIRRYSLTEMSRAVVLQAAGAAMIEAYCDEENERLKEEFRKEGYFLRPRFSPGYGDFPLSAQRDLLQVLEASKRVGITLTDSLLMVPSKSVTAVIGVGRAENNCELKGCELCGNELCRYRRGQGESK